MAFILKMACGHKMTASILFKMCCLSRQAEYGRNGENGRKRCAFQMSQILSKSFLGRLT